MTVKSKGHFPCAGEAPPCFWGLLSVVKCEAHGMTCSHLVVSSE